MPSACSWQHSERGCSCCSVQAFTQSRAGAARTYEDEVERRRAERTVGPQEVGVELLGDGRRQDGGGHGQPGKADGERGDLCAHARLQRVRELLAVQSMPSLRRAAGQQLGL